MVSLAIIGRGGIARERRVAHEIRIGRRMGSAALALAYVASGRFDAYVQNGGLSLWDIAAAGLIAERAGAVVTDLYGGPWWNVSKRGPRLSIVAAPRRHHGTLLALLREARTTVADAPLGGDARLAQDGGEHRQGPGGGAPDAMPGVAVDRGAQDPARSLDQLLADRVIGQQVAQRELHDLGHLVGVGMERRAGSPPSPRTAAARSC